MNTYELSVAEKNEILSRRPDAYHVECTKFLNLALLHYRNGERAFVHRLTFKTSPQFHDYDDLLETLIILVRKNEEKCFFNIETMEWSCWERFDEHKTISNDFLFLTKKEADQQGCFFDIKALKYSRWMFTVGVRKIETVAGHFWCVDASDGAVCFFYEKTMLFSPWFSAEDKLLVLKDSNQVLVVSKFNTRATLDLLTSKLSSWSVEV